MSISAYCPRCGYRTENYTPGLGCPNCARDLLQESPWLLTCFLCGQEQPKPVVAQERAILAPPD